ncbi:MAG TPA: hypothetical protein VEP90_03980 [Methylomirabilota bacterium]|nr:hypothetical protein [Methylomirabilota bacterium]
MDPVFATLIAKLFQNSFRNNVTKQNFKLTKDRNQLSLLALIDKFVGRNKFQEELGEEGRLDIFNASSFCSNLLVRLIKS